MISRQDHNSSVKGNPASYYILGVFKFDARHDKLKAYRQNHEAVVGMRQEFVVNMESTDGDRLEVVDTNVLGQISG